MEYAKREGMKMWRCFNCACYNMESSYICKNCLLVKTGEKNKGDKK